MLATFCLRLACGLAGALLLLCGTTVNPRFYRTHFLTILGLTAMAAVVWPAPVAVWMWAMLAAVMACAFLGSLLWSLEGAPGGRILVVATALVLVAVLVLAALESPAAVPANRDGMGNTGYIAAGAGWLLADALTSAAFLGLAATALLMGHSYLIAPAMSLTPLLRLLGALLTATGLRMAVAGFGLWSWTRGHSLDNLGDVVLWLLLRWGLGFVGPLILGWMAWQTAKIRSTQSATGILYVVVIFCFLGELTSQLLVKSTGYVL